jgi:hypothetical protein
MGKPFTTHSKSLQSQVCGGRAVLFAIATERSSIVLDPQFCYAEGSGTLVVINKEKNDLIMATKKAEARTTPRKRVTPKNQTAISSDGRFPGYPKYSPDEDITKRAKRVDENLDDEVLTQVKHNKEPKVASTELVDESERETKNDFDVTNEDLEALGPKDLSMDMGEDEQLKHRTRPVDFSGKDLDVPGSELDDDQEAAGAEDEENNNYSLGGDGKSDLEESQQHERGL